MSFGLPKSSGSGTSRRRRAAGFSEINVTPLVDVMLVLLVVFMITAPMMTTGVPLDLPTTKAAKLNDQIEPIVISVDASGKSYLQETELQGDALIARLMVVTESNPDARIYVRGDANLSYGRIMEVMGDIAASGFTKVSLLAEMPKGKAKAPVLRPSGAPTVIPAVGTGTATTGAAITNVSQSAATAQQPMTQPRPQMQTAARPQVQPRPQTQQSSQGKQTMNRRPAAAPISARQNPPKQAGSQVRQARPAPNRG